MGYESKFYIVNKTTQKSLDGTRYWAEVIAMFDLCKVPAIYGKIQNYPKTDTFIFSDGDKEVTEDKYGEDLIEIPINDLIDIVDNVIHTEDYYRRYKPFMDLLKGFDTDDWDNLVVLHYGY